MCRKGEKLEEELHTFIEAELPTDSKEEGKEKEKQPGDLEEEGEVLSK